MKKSLLISIIFGGPILAFFCIKVVSRSPAKRETWSQAYGLCQEGENNYDHKDTTYLRRTYYKPALRLFKQAIAEDPTNLNYIEDAVTSRVLGDVYWELGLYKEAKIYYLISLHNEKKENNGNYSKYKLYDKLNLCEEKLNNKTIATFYAKKSVQLNPYPPVTTNTAEYSSNTTSSTNYSSTATNNKSTTYRSTNTYRPSTYRATSTYTPSTYHSSSTYQPSTYHSTSTYHAPASTYHPTPTYHYTYHK